MGRGAAPTRGAAPAKVRGALALFPGMAAAFPGMGGALAGTPDGRRTFQEFGRWSGLDVAAAASDLPESDLFRDRTWELAVIATEAAALAAWRAGGGVVAASLGFSIGAYAALLSAGAVSIEQVVAMVDVVLEASRLLPGRYAMAAPIVASDSDPRAVAATRRNARAAGVADEVLVEARDARNLVVPGPGALIVTNPPYGERLGDAGELPVLYREFGDALKRRAAGCTAWLLVGNPALAKAVGLRPARRIVLFNGPIECRLLRFDLYEGKRGDCA